MQKLKKNYSLEIQSKFVQKIVFSTWQHQLFMMFLETVYYVVTTIEPWLKWHNSWSKLRLNFCHIFSLFNGLCEHSSSRCGSWNFRIIAEFQQWLSAQDLWSKNWLKKICLNNSGKHDLIIQREKLFYFHPLTS